MTDFIQGENRYQDTLFPERLDEYINARWTESDYLAVDECSRD